MMPESIQPRLLKSAILFNRGGAGAAIPNQTVRGNAKRHSLIIYCNNQWNITYPGTTDPMFRSPTAEPFQKVFTYEEFGDLLSRQSVIAINPAATECFIAETYFDEANQPS